MTAPHADQLIDGYLARIRDTAGDLPAAARKELLDDMRGHIAEARVHEPDETDATILNILDRLGEPSVVVSEARERLGIRPVVPSRPGLLDIAAVFLIWMLWPIGVILLWVSPAWNSRDKLIGSLVPMLGYGALIANGEIVRHTGGGDVPGIVSAVLPIVAFGAPPFGALYLAIRLRMGRPREVAAG